ncbi:MAG: MSEP-CTERM sorting domain-containing protein [Sulfurovum sp.]
MNKILLNPKLLIAINTLPLLIYIFIFSQSFSIVEPLLSSSNIDNFYIFISLTIVMMLGSFIYALYLIIKKELISYKFAFILLVISIVYIYLLLYSYDAIFPRSIPFWMMSSNSELYIFSFLMPSILYALFMLVSYNIDDEKSFTKYLIISITIPIGWYLFFMLIIPLFRGYHSRLIEHFIAIISVTVGVVFLFSLLKWFYLFFRKRDNFFQKLKIILFPIITLILPIVGLNLNESSMFGDFSSIWFYILTVVNAFFLMLPNLSNFTYRLVLFFARSFTFAYTLYFFFVFVPFVPLGVLALFFLFVGILILTPIIVTLVHIYILVEDFNYLRSNFNQNILVVTFFIALLMIPSFIYINYLNDKKVLFSAIDYIYKPNYEKKHYDIDLESLKKTLESVKSHKSMNFRRGEREIPFLSSLFNYVVLDNLTLSDIKVHTIENIFWGNQNHIRQIQNLSNNNVSIEDIDINTSFNAQTKTYRSFIHFSFKNHKESGRFQEYITTFRLPNGAYISDYYLDVKEKRKYGLLTDKKSAMWVYNQITKSQKDPGILHYDQSGSIVFKVFPFSPNEVRKSGFEIIHTEPISFSIDSHLIKLQAKELDKVLTHNKISYISKQIKSTLPKVDLPTYYHFVVDSSKSYRDLIKQIESFTTEHNISSNSFKITLTDTFTKEYNPIELDNRYKNKGFYLNRAIKEILYDYNKNKSRGYPLIIYLTNDEDGVIVDKSLSQFRTLYSLHPYFYQLNNGKILHYSFDNPKKALDTIKDFRANIKALKYQNHYLADNNQSTLLFNPNLQEINSVEPKSFKGAMILQNLQNAYYIESQNSNKEWRNIVKHSFNSHILTLFSSFIVVENKAQENMILAKQKEVMSGDSSLDLADATTTTRRMSEPSLFMILLLLLGVHTYRRLFMKMSKKPNQI